MELRTATIGVARVPVGQRIMDYLELAKARLVLMILVVTMVGFYMGAPGVPDWGRLLHLLLGVAFAAGGSLALNAYIEREVDALMSRTQTRPVPEGRIQPLAALRFGIITTVWWVALSDRGRAPMECYPDRGHHWELSVWVYPAQNENVAMQYRWGGVRRLTTRGGLGGGTRDL